MTAGLGRRARNLQEMGANFAVQGTEVDPAYRAYEPLPGDVFITCWAKSGTTMMQQMFHQLRMGAATGAGDMDFDDISRMTPWDDTARFCGTDMMQAQRAAPRGFKSHREYERLPPGHALRRHLARSARNLPFHASLLQRLAGRGGRAVARGAVAGVDERRPRRVRLRHPFAELVCAEG